MASDSVIFCYRHGEDGNWELIRYHFLPLSVTVSLFCSLDLRSDLVILHTWHQSEFKQARDSASIVRDKHICYINYVSWKILGKRFAWILFNIAGWIHSTWLLELSSNESQLYPGA